MKFAMQLGYALCLFAIVCPIKATNPLPTLELRREQAIESTIYGCTRAIEDSAIIQYMKRRADAGNPAASEAEARTEVESTASWKDQMLPTLQKNCACLFATPLSGLRNSRTDDELNITIAKMQEMQTTSLLSELEDKAPGCFSDEPKR